MRTTTRALMWATAMLGALLWVGPLAAQQGPYVPIPAQQLQLQATAPAPPTNATATYQGLPGSETLFYVVVANYPRGQSPMSNLASVINTSTLSATNVVTVGWRAPAGATSVDVLKFVGSPSFSGNCAACALATGVAPSALGLNDTGGALAAYIHNPVGVANAVISVDNQSAAQPFINMRLLNTNFRMPLVGPFTAGSLAAFDARGNLVDGAAPVSGLADPGSNGIVVRTALNTTVARTLIGGTGLTILNGDGVAANPTLTPGCPAGLISQVQYTDGAGNCLGSADFTFDGDFVHLASGPTKGIRFGDDDAMIFEESDDVIALGITAANLRIQSSRASWATPVIFNGGNSTTNPNIQLDTVDTDTGFYWIAAGNLGLTINGLKYVEYGGSQSWLLEDTLAVTGVTTGVVRAGAGQANTNILFGTQDAASNPLVRVTGLGSFATRPSQTTASAATLTLPAGNLFHLSGTTNITTLNTCDATSNGRSVQLIFDGVLTFTDGNNLILAGDFVTTADDTIYLICDGTNWYELGRSVN